MDSSEGKRSRDRALGMLSITTTQVVGFANIIHSRSPIPLQVPPGGFVGEADHPSAAAMSETFWTSRRVPGICRKPWCS